MKTPTYYLSKRENGTYSLIVNGTSVNQYADKETCLKQAARFNAPAPLLVWECATGTFISE